MRTISVDGLRDAIAEIDRIPNEEWLRSLDVRKRRELEFHDRYRDRSHAFYSQPQAARDSFDKVYGNKKYYATISRSRSYVDQWLARHTPSAVFLDYACGDGATAIKVAQLGAALSCGLDISRGSIENARRDAAGAGVASQTCFFQADAENTRLPANSIDVAICSGMLHHLDLSFAFPELRRILAPGGRLLCVEALDYNPAIKLYRYLTPEMRTEWEKAHILSMADVGFARRFFDLGELRFWHVTSYLAAHVPALQGLLDGVDDVLTRLPGVRLMAWTFTFELLKPAE